MEIDLRMDGNALSATAASQIIFKNLDVMMIVGNGELGLQLAGSENIFECKVFECEIISADINVQYGYRSAVGFWKIIVLFGAMPALIDGHKLKTSNTIELLQIINRSKF